MAILGGASITEARLNDSDMVDFYFVVSANGYIQNGLTVRAVKEATIEAVVQMVIDATKQDIEKNTAIKFGILDTVVCCCPNIVIA